MEEKTFLGKTKHFLMFAGPAMVGFIAVVIIPFIYGLYLTFTDWGGIGNHKNLVGFANYITVFQDGAFWKSLLLTLGYVIVSVIMINIVAFILAYLLTSGMKAQNFLRAGFFTPNLIGGIVLGFIWEFVFTRTLPVIGQTLGIPLFEKSWLSDPTTAFWAFVIVTVWQYSGYMMLIYVAGFVGVPKDLTEAASIDGCTGFQVTRYVTIPLMVPSFVICLFLSVTRTFMVYDLNLSLTNGGPYESTKMAAMYVYQMAFNSQRYGVGQAEAIILFVVVAAIALTQTYLGKRMEVDA
ncbi:Maltose transport system permease protein malF [uncultured Ruminococcus sp.]|nr:sugar ABC transporter permease [Massiliimalia timonensis]MBS7176569.1 sugar ABC transporter permease [Clostridiales bacterium]SCI15602.1 Maltose transport system permease protein malF [uncultured Clostridium sp.]SCI39016.1 Maltose transport system permease protein malF [uncultured Ruminococcus sp.]